MASATLTMSDEVKPELKQFSWINWSEVAKEELLKKEKKLKLFNELEKLTKNSELTDKDILLLSRKARKGRFKELKSKGLV